MQEVRRRRRRRRFIDKTEIKRQDQLRVPLTVEQRSKQRTALTLSQNNRHASFEKQETLP
jgi:hypothetical protein